MRQKREYVYLKMMSIIERIEYFISNNIHCQIIRRQREYRSRDNEYEYFTIFTVDNIRLFSNILQYSRTNIEPCLTLDA